MERNLGCANFNPHDCNARDLTDGMQYRTRGVANFDPNDRNHGYHAPALSGADAARSASSSESAVRSISTTSRRISLALRDLGMAIGVLDWLWLAAFTG
jgi:hypothetical protein